MARYSRKYDRTTNRRKSVEVTEKMAAKVRGQFERLRTHRAKGALRKRASSMATMRICCGTPENGLVSELGSMQYPKADTRLQ